MCTNKNKPFVGDDILIINDLTNNNKSQFKIDFYYLRMTNSKSIH